jgi:hypothetical protein
MKINFTKAEYRLLVEMLTIADWVMHSRCTNNEFTHKKHHELRNKILSHYKEFEAESIIDSGFEKDQFYETDELLDHIHNNFMSDYIDSVFWDELIHKMALRDVVNEVGSAYFEKMEEMERFRKIASARERYEDEFEQNDLKNVIINLSTEK